MDFSKVGKLKHLLHMNANGDGVLLFSQLKQVLGTVELVLTALAVGPLGIDGATPVDARQDLVEQFHEGEIKGFLLSANAGGCSINLVCANKVIIFDSSFNRMSNGTRRD